MGLGIQSAGGVPQEGEVVLVEIVLYCFIRQQWWFSIASWFVGAFEFSQLTVQNGHFKQQDVDSSCRRRKG